VIPPPTPGIPEGSKLVELASGVDALYLSGRASLPTRYIGYLTDLRLRSEETDDGIPCQLGGEEFRLAPYAFGKHRFCLIHPFGRVGLTPSDKLPAIRIQPRAEFLHGAGAMGVVEFFRSILEEEFGPTMLTVSRIDLHSDWQGWVLGGNDRHRFVCRASDLATYEASESFNGFQFGKRSSGTIGARIYDKTAELLKSGSAYWFDIWGAEFNRGLPVLRVEFELGRTALRQYGLETPEDVLAATGALWVNLTNAWLSFRTSTQDSTKSRWPVAPEWLQVCRARISDGAYGIERMYAGKCRGELRKLAPALVGYLATVAALADTDSLEVSLVVLRRLVQWYGQVTETSFEQRAIRKRIEHELR
jgi:hypothetical protein